MNPNSNLPRARKTAAAFAIFFALLCGRQSAHAQTSAGTNALQFANGGVITTRGTIIRGGGIPPPDLPPPWTAEMWVNRADAAGASAVLFNSATSGLKLEQFGSPNRNVGITVYGSADYSFNYTASAGTWTHLAFVGTSDGVTLYVNGVETDTIPTPISLPLQYFGSQTVDFLNATVDEVSVWNYARSAADIKSSCHFPTAPQSGQTLLWHFDEPPGNTVVTDSSGNGHDGTINNATRLTSTAPIYVQTLLVGGTSLSLHQAVNIANSVGNMIINFNPSFPGQTHTLASELDITNDLTIDASSLSSPVTYTTLGNRHFVISPSVNVTMTGINLASGLAAAVYPAGSLGGSISNAGNLTLNNVVFTGNQAVGSDGTTGGQSGAPGANADGGAIFNASQGTLTLNQCTFASNSVSGGAGTIANLISGAGGQARGGAIYNAGTLTANLSSFYGQTNTGGLNGQGTVAGTAQGGALCNIATGTAVFNECTFTGNTLVVPGPAGTQGNAEGGAIFSNGQLTLNQSTLISNLFTTTFGGNFLGGSVFQNAQAAIFNSILGPDGVQQNLAHYTATGVNLIDAAPDLAPLGNYGGPTLTMPPVAGSPVIDAGDDSALNFFPTDQRGFPRDVGAHVDIGAAEATPPLLDTLASATISTNTATGTYTILFSANATPNGAPSSVTFQYGALPFTGSNSVDIPGSVTVSNASVTVNISRGYQFYWNTVATNIMGSTSSATMQQFTPAFSTDVPGDLNGDGVVSQVELSQVYASYLATSPAPLITSAVGLGQSNLNFAISSGLVLTYTVQVSTNLLDWTTLGPAQPLYNFMDTNAPAAPQRYYRLVYP